MSRSALAEPKLRAILTKIGGLCKVRRKQMRISQTLAARSMNIDYRHYQNIEGGKINIRLDTLLKLVEFYNFNLTETEENIGALARLIQGPGQPKEWPLAGATSQEVTEDSKASNQAYFVFDRSSERITHGNLQAAALFGFKTADALSFLPLSCVMSTSDLTKFKSALEQNLPPAEVDPVLVYIRSPHRPAPTPVVFVATIERETKSQLVSVLLLDRSALAKTSDRLSREGLRLAQPDLSLAANT